MCVEPGSAAGGPPAPLDVAFGRARLSSDCRMLLDPQGRRVVYQVRTPPEQAPEGGPRFLSSGAPANANGQTLHYAELDSDAGHAGNTVRVGPEGANCWHGSWSPDGQLLAFYSDAPGFPQLWIHDVRTGSGRPVNDVRINAKLWLGDEPQWFPAGDEVVVPLEPEADGRTAPPVSTPSVDGPTVRVYRSRDEPDDTGSVDQLNEHYLRENNAVIAAVDVVTGAIRPLVPANADPPPSAAQVSPRGRWVSYFSVYLADVGGPATSDVFHDLLVVPAAGGKPTVVARHLAMSASPGGYDLDTYVWHPTRDQLFWIDQGQLWTLELDNGPGEPRRLAMSLSDLTVHPLLLTRSGEQLIVGVDPVGPPGGDRNPPPRHLAAVPLDGTPPTLIPLPDGLAEASVVPQRPGVAWEPRAGTIAVRMLRPSTAESVLLRVDLAPATAVQLWEGLAALEPAGAPVDHRFLVAAYEDFRRPRDLWLLTADGRRYRRLTTVDPWLECVRLGPVETFQIRVPQPDGTFADATTAVLLPAGYHRGDRLPAVMFCYPNARVSRCAAEFAGGMPSTLPLLPFLDRGYAVLLAEAPIGPEGRPGNPLDELASVLVPQLYHAAELGYVDLERVALAGHSYGGYGTAATISVTNVFAAAVAIAGMYDLASGYGRLRTGGPASMSWWFETGQGRMGAPLWEAPQRYYANSPYHRADRISTPLLLIHGAADYMCPADDAGMLYSVLKRLGQDVELAIYDGEGHVPFEWSRVNAVDALGRVLAFLDQHLEP